MRKFYLTEEIKHYWIIIDPYFNDEQQRELFHLSMNSVCDNRIKIGLKPRKKGRPKSSLLFKDTKNDLPEEVKNAVAIIKRLVKKMEEDYYKHKQAEMEKKKLKEEKKKSYENMKNKYKTNNINKEDK